MLNIEAKIEFITNLHRNIYYKMHQSVCYKMTSILLENREDLLQKLAAVLSLRLEIQAWCPAESVLLHGEKVSL